VRASIHVVDVPQRWSDPEITTISLYPDVCGVHMHEYAHVYVCMCMERDLPSDPMDMVLDSKTVAGFNLSFFSTELALIDAYMTQIIEWLSTGAILLDESRVFPITQIGLAHRLIQSGQSIGKIVVAV
jgi:NADPH:quinone reductase-like Zn-dependent oxidoreductase